MKNRTPLRGEVWLADLHPTRGREQSGRRPVLVVSDDTFNRGPADLVIVAPMTTRLRGIPSHVVVQPPDGGLRQPTAILCEAVRSISKGRLVERWGELSRPRVARVEEVLSILLSL